MVAFAVKDNFRTSHTKGVTGSHFFGYTAYRFPIDVSQTPLRMNWKWFVLIMVFLATGLNFLDRQVLSIVIIRIQEEFGMTDVQYGMINTAFLIGYGIMFTVAGRLIDTVGSKLGLAVSVGVWSVANCFHGLVNNFHQLFASRLALGLGEGGCFPGAAK